MSDLSRLLDDVYGTADDPSAAERAALFSGWLPEAGPGPVTDDPSVVADHLAVVPDPVEALEAILDLGAAERSGHEAAPEPVVTGVPTPRLYTWTLADDDILPTKASRRRIRLRRR